jgi:hypothetical protein
MNAKAATRSSANTVNVGREQSHGANFAKVLDGRKQPIRALWMRNGRFYAQLKIENPITGLKKTRWLDDLMQPIQAVIWTTRQTVRNSCAPS